MFEDKHFEINRYLFILDICISILMFLIAFWFRYTLPFDIFIQIDKPDLFSHIALIPLLLSFLIFFLSRFGAYKGPRVSSIGHYIWAIARAMFISITILLTLLFLLRVDYISRSIILSFALLNIITLSMVRTFFFLIF
ncbi:hypothetical protein D3OALGA1CA_2717 [Olavius algarvensis associated proteobacterium Delta 3]|nr:hypothetical protein D3OALGB2SA_2676 [Olavius algarvensis associated proteobacterium Delta 3]CAB5123267.1 hypothetical protein D3OALGA1CA_2717 [Olavius algarvensis associated proteobacterium Delta 3]